MISDIFVAIGEGITGFVGALTDGLGQIIGSLYVADTGLTLLGTLFVITASVGIVYWAFRMVRNLFALRG